MVDGTQKFLSVILNQIRPDFESLGHKDRADPLLDELMALVEKTNQRQSKRTAKID